MNTNGKKRSIAKECGLDRLWNFLLEVILWNVQLCGTPACGAPVFDYYSGSDHRSSEKRLRPFLTICYLW